ncbi:hypothetical protein FGW20_05615 [Methanoculleus sp. FWC-SCC3]|uniref:Uncharacterized protein n=1 Tax=Methanoculleus methanifontis TaxID=2584086 RepID=A0ABT8M0H6_9EURY|nr:hypothetical protein [Methanoculleus sp. FWC-SCC3]MDN7012525.1 hypothetical protein [Methanoculleus sp. FWC-SCC3]
MRPMTKLLLVLLAASLLCGTAAASYSLTDTNSYDYKLASKYIHSMEDEGFVVEMPIGVYRKGTDELLATENTLLIIGNLGKVDPEAERLVLTEIPTDVYSYTYQGDVGGGEIRQITGEVTAGRYIFTEFGLTTKYRTVGEYAGYLQTVLEESVKSSSAEIEYVDTTINGHRVVGVRELTDDLNRAGNVADNHLENTFTYYVIREDFYPAGSGLAHIRLRGHVGLEHDNGRSLTYDPYPSENQVAIALSEMRKAYEDANKVVDSVIADAANAKATLIVGNYDEVFGGYGGGAFSINTPGGGAGESDYGIPLAVITGIGAAGAAVAGAAAAAGGGKGGSETERTSTYRMRIRKDFEDYIVCGKSPETIYAQMIEITAEGETIERDDLTATLSITSGGGLRVEDPTFTGSYMGAFVSADENELAEEGIVKVAYTGKGGSFTNNIHFRIIGEPRVTFPEQGEAMDLRLNVLYGDGMTYDVEVELVDFIEPPKEVTITQLDEAPFTSSLEKIDDTHYIAKIVNTSTLPVKGAKVTRYGARVIATTEDDRVVEEAFTVIFYPEGISVTDVVYDDEGHARFAAYDDLDTEEDDVQPTGFIVNLAVRVDENGKEVVKLLDGTDYAPEFGELKGTDQRTEVLASRFKYTIEKKPDNTNKAYKFTPAQQIGEDERNPYFLTLPITCDYGGETYELDLPIRLIGDKLGVRKDRETELANLKKRIQKFGINPDTARFLRENVQNFTAAELRLMSKKIVYDSIVYYTQESADFMETAETMDDWISFLSVVKWFGDQAFSYLMTVYTGPAGEAILTPTKELTVELIGEISADLFMGNGVNWDDIKVGVHISEMIENYTKSCFEDIGKTNPKKLAQVIAGLCVFNLVRHYSFDLDENGKRSLYNAIISSFSDISLEFFSNKFGDFLKGKVNDPKSGISRLLDSSAVKMLEDMMPEGKLAVPGVNTLTEDVAVGPILQNYVEGLFGAGASYVTEELGTAAAETLYVKVTVDVPGSEREIDRYVVIDPIKAADKLLEYIFTSLYEAFPFPTAEPGAASELRDPLYMDPKTNQRIG